MSEFHLHWQNLAKLHYVSLKWQLSGEAAAPSAPGGEKPWYKQRFGKISGGSLHLKMQNYVDFHDFHIVSWNYVNIGDFHEYMCFYVNCDFAVKRPPETSPEPYVYQWFSPPGEQRHPFQQNTMNSIIFN